MCDPDFMDFLQKNLTFLKEAFKLNVFLNKAPFFQNIYILKFPYLSISYFSFISNSQEISDRDIKSKQKNLCCEYFITYIYYFFKIHILAFFK